MWFYSNFRWPLRVRSHDGGTDDAIRIAKCHDDHDAVRVAKCHDNGRTSDDQPYFCLRWYHCSPYDYDPSSYEYRCHDDGNAMDCCMMMMMIIIICRKTDIYLRVFMLVGRYMMMMMWSFVNIVEVLLHGKNNYSTESSSKRAERGYNR
mmetsp:Transcript_7926/g.11571  ORF Transcript_7926/g.11571 Transcript_7926/m.11571 type:complete len:149 (+) Transcript_7926:228-674(+)